MDMGLACPHGDRSRPDGLAADHLHHIHVDAIFAAAVEVEAGAMRRWTRSPRMSPERAAELRTEILQRRARWFPEAKREVVRALAHGIVTIEDITTAHGMNLDELAEWQRKYGVREGAAA